MKTRPEIVAPAGSPGSFSAALNAGADAVYAGAPGFNMRAGADPIDIDAIRDMTVRAHDKGMKLFFAMNVIAYDGEFDNAARMMDAAADIGVDAVILWDMGLLNLANERELTIHLSTQASVSNSQAAAAYETLGIKRIVLARELSLEQIKGIIDDTRRRGSDMAFECFVHGAMCVAVSGRCLTSQFQYGRSANRGDCLQPCRRTYRVIDTTNDEELELDGNTIMSARDLCTIEFADKLVESGIAAFKIEGRMRDPNYVRTAVECYREAVDAVMDGSFDRELAAKLKARLERVFHRGFSNGFYFSRPDLDMTEERGNTSPVVRAFLGRIENYFHKAKAADITLTARGVTVGDTVLITGPTTGAVEFVLDSIHSEDGRSIDHADQRDLIGVSVPERVRVGDKMYVIVERETDNSE